MRVDRLDPAKNVVRGFLAFAVLLVGHPEWRERVTLPGAVPVAGNAGTSAYARGCVAIATAIDATLGTPGLDPGERAIEETYARSVAGYLIYDVLLVNPIADGMNLVAMEGPLVNRRQGVLMLSRHAGAFDARAPRDGGAPVRRRRDRGGDRDGPRASPRRPRSAQPRARARGALARNPVRWLTTQLRDLDASVAMRGSQTGQDREEALRALDAEIGHSEEGVGGL